MRTLNTANVFITQVSDVLSVVQDILNEIERDKIPASDLRDIDRAMSLLAITENDCDNFVKEIEAGPAFNHGGRS